MYIINVQTTLYDVIAITYEDLKPEVEIMVSSKFGHTPWVSELGFNYKIYRPKY
jgi:hypothetical protein